MDDLDKAQQEVVQAYHMTFSTPYGQTVLDDLFKSCYMNRTTYVTGDPHSTLVNEGMRSVVVLILDMLRRSPDFLTQEHRHGGQRDLFDSDPSDDDTGHLYYPVTGNV